MIIQLYQNQISFNNVHPHFCLETKNGIENKTTEEKNDRCSNIDVSDSVIRIGNHEA